MARTKHSTEASERILSRLREAMGREPASAVKFSQVKKALAWAVSDVAVGTKLPSVRDIAAASGVTAVPAQRAVMELVNEGRLRSVPRSGIFVGEVSETGEGTERRAFAELRHHLRFGTDSSWDFQQEFWAKLTRGFEELHPNVGIVVKAVSEPGVDPDCDVFERSEWLEPYPELHEDTLDASALLAEQRPATPRDGRGVTLYHRTYYLFFNRPLLRRLGLPEPSYRTFAAQQEYLEAAARLAPPPVTVCQPVTLLGREARAFLSVIRTAGAELAPASLDAWRRTARTARLFKYRQHECAKEFLEGVCPLYSGYGVELWKMLAQSPSFDWAVYPQLRADDSLFLWPRVGLLPRWSRLPLEATQFLAYLSESGRSFAAIGDIPARPGAFDTPHLAADPGWFQALAARSEPLRLADPTERYLFSSALNGELWRLLGDRSADPDEAAARAVRLGRAYLASVCQ